MSFWSNLFGWISNDSPACPVVDVDHTAHPVYVTNPATGLPMIDDSYSGVDVGGSPFGLDVHNNGGSVGGYGE